MGLLGVESSRRMSGALGWRVRRICWRAMGMFWKLRSPKASVMASKELSGKGRWRASRRWKWMRCWQWALRAFCWAMCSI